jgi:hypothetical protein
MRAVQLSRLLTTALALSCVICLGARAQKFLPDDPISRDPDNLNIEKPAQVELGPTWDFAINSFGNEAQGPLLRAQNINTLGQVPDSSWFANRIGSRNMSLDEIARGNDLTGGPDVQGEITVVGAALISISEGMVIQDSRGDWYYLILDSKRYPNLVTGASVIANRVFHAAGYHVLPNYLVELDPSRFRLHPDAQVVKLGAVKVPMTQEYINLALESAARRPDGKYRALAIHLVPGADPWGAAEGGPSLGEFQFHGTRSDDPNDLYLHENRRELRGMRLFAAWLNFSFCNAIVTRDLWVSEGGNKFIKHFMVDFSGSLGAGRDFDDNQVPKDARSGNEDILPGNIGWTLKTAATLGFWYRPWMKIDYPSFEFPELGRIDGDYFRPEIWLPEYPNAAFTRMLPDDAYWAARIIDRFSDEAIDAIVAQADYEEPGAAELLAEILKKRRDKIVQKYYGEVNPIDEFQVEGGSLNFRNLGEERGIASITAYEYEWFSLDNQSGALTPIGERQVTPLTRLQIPEHSGEFLVARLRTRSETARGWRKNVDVYLKMDSGPEVVGIEREAGIFVLDRSLEGRQVVRSSIEFAGTYEGLEYEQRRLIDDFAERAQAVTQGTLEPAQVYSDLPMSVRTTFEGVTNALLESHLTDANGESLGTALDLVAQVERVNGSIQGVGGDQQFRMYCTLVPNVVEILEKSTQFSRGPDNTVYHKGYLISYRQQGGAPSIQISMAETGNRADIDVDYRSSKFPGALVNGHLTSANSDVREGDNYQRHSGRWGGLMDWWRGIFGLPEMRTILGLDQPERLLIPRVPRMGDAKEVKDAVQDFLKAWMVDGEPQEAVAYLAERAYYCMDMGDVDAVPDFGVAPLLLVERFAGARAALGNPQRLQSVISAAQIDDSRLTRIELDATYPFTLYEVPKDAALGFDCASRNELQAVAAGRPQSYGKYYGAVFRVTGPKGKSAAIASLWAKVEGHWKAVSYKVMPDEGTSLAPALPPPAVSAVQQVVADPAFLTANESFLEAWGQGRIDDAMKYLGESCFDCANLYRRDDQAPVQNWAEAETLIRAGLQRLSDALQGATDILDVIEPVEVVHPDIRIVEHAHQNAYTIMSSPDYLAEQYDCRRIVGNTVDYSRPAEKVYGNYYGTAIRFKLAGEDPAVLYLIWSRVDGSWKITSYSVLRP